MNHIFSSHETEKAPQRPLAALLVAALVVGALGGLFGGALGSYYAPDVLHSLFGISRDATVSRVGTSVIAVKEESATIDVVKKAAPSVVSIIISKDLSKIYHRTGPNIFPFDDFFDGNLPFRFQQNQQPPDTRGEKQKVGGGSGFIISADGLILTNKHVVGDEDADYMVVTNDGKEYPAKVLAKDTVNDLAIIKIQARDLPALELDDSSAIQIGQTVIAIGNTLGEYSNTVTRGVVSGVNRVVQATDSGTGSVEVIQEAIQTDAAINPGNSGGPLLNLAGHVIGINTAVNQTGQSIGFALPINVAKKSVESVKRFGRIIRPWIGVRYTLVTKEIAKKNSLPVDYGALVHGDAVKKELAVINGSPADKAGLSEGDIILEVNGQKLDSGHALANAINQYSPGDIITLKILSHGKEKMVPVTLEEFKEQKISQ